MICPLCTRDLPSLEKHHLRTRRKDREDVEKICRDCHSQIHALFSNTELRDARLGLDTIESLLENDRMAKAIAFVRKHPAGSRVTTNLSKHARRRR
jgi:5-methylcytosine-specific restriction protein A